MDGESKRYTRLTERDWATAETLYECRWMRLQRAGDWHRVAHPASRSAVVVFRDPDGRIAFVRQHRNPVAEVTLELPRGASAPGEDHVDCALREGWEETGLRGDRDRARLVGWLYGDTSLTNGRIGVVLVDVPPVAAGALRPPFAWEIDGVEFLAPEEIDARLAEGGLHCPLSIAAVALVRARGA